MRDTAREYLAVVLISRFLCVSVPPWWAWFCGIFAAMPWIKTVKPQDASPELLRAMEAQKELYPIEYALPVNPSESGGASIVESHSLIPQALYHAFATFGAL